MLAAALAVLAAIIIVPPLVSVSRYKSRIARAISNSIGRPVHLSGVELHLFPRPEFAIGDLTVEEDPEYGAEPVLHANEVTAAIRLSSLWRGRLEISRISVDEASLNLVHTTAGRWNLDTLFRTAAQPRADGSNSRHVPLPYLEATNSRINIKQGIEKLPYSLVSADLAFWQEEPGNWRVRLKGQPARTDVSLDLGDTGIVQLEGRMQRTAPEMRQMPVHLELEWRNAQLGQLSRLLIGSDPGWRGDLTAQMRVDGTAESAQVRTRLRATGVHRAEFAPATPLDFDANCGLVYHYSARTIEKLVCDSPLGDGRLRVEGELPSNAEPKVSVELQRIPAQGVLDALRTVRNQFGAGLAAEGSLSGKLTYDATLQTEIPLPEPARRSKRPGKAKSQPSPPGTLSGSITLDSLNLSGGDLNPPVRIQKMVFEPDSSADGKGEFLRGTANVLAGAPSPLGLTLRLSPNGYAVTIRGMGTPQRVRQLAHAAGLKEAGALDAIAGDPVTLDLSIAGPWLPPPEVLLAENEGASGAAVPAPNIPVGDQTIADRLTGTVALHNANWKTDSLTAAVQIPQAVLHLSGGAKEWDPVEFAYGPLKGTARVEIPTCGAEEECVPTLDLDFATLVATELQSALLGSDKKGTLLSAVIARLTPSSEHKWPAFQGTVRAESLKLGPFALEGIAAEVKVSAGAAELTSLDAGALGGRIRATGKIEKGDQPDYAFEGQFQGVSPAELCRMLELKCTGTSLDGDGKIKLAGYTGKDLGESATGTLHFDWEKGAVSGRVAPPGDAIPAALTRFDNWTADAEIADGVVTLKDNEVQLGKRKAAVNASIRFGEPPKVSFASSKSPSAAKK